MKKNILHLENLIQDYILGYRAESKSPNTVEEYSYFLRLFLTLLYKNESMSTVTQIDKQATGALFN